MVRGGVQGGGNGGEEDGGRKELEVESELAEEDGSDGEGQAGLGGADSEVPLS